MKRKLLFAFAIITVLAMAIAALAYTRTTTVGVSEKACCCKADSCPMMKNKDGHTGEHGKDHAKGEGHNCCGDSCPMKGENHKSGDHSKMEGHNCCGDSCPMKKKDGTTVTTASSTADDKKSCCENCDCCKGKAKEKSDAAAV